MHVKRAYVSVSTENHNQTRGNMGRVLPFHIEFQTGSFVEFFLLISNGIHSADVDVFYDWS